MQKISSIPQENKKLLQNQPCDHLLSGRVFDRTASHCVREDLDEAGTGLKSPRCNYLDQGLEEVRVPEKAGLNFCGEQGWLKGIFFIVAWIKVGLRVREG